VLGFLFFVDARPVQAQGSKPAPGEMRWGLHVTLAARWLDPAEAEAFSTRFEIEAAPGREKRVEADHILGDLLARARRLAVPAPLLAAAFAHLSIYQRRVSSR
jgi:hypothetical protein